MEGRRRPEDRVELVRVHAGDPRGIQVADPALQLEPGR